MKKICKKTNTKTLQQVEEELKEFINKFLPEEILSVETIKKWVYEESGDPLQATYEFQDKISKYFNGTEADINELLQISTEAWNYFPHKILSNKSPFQIAKEYQDKI